MGLVRMHGHVEAPVEAVFDYAVDFNRIGRVERQHHRDGAGGRRSPR